MSLHPRQWLKSFWQECWTDILGYSKLIVGSFLVSFHYLGDLITNPDVKSALSSLQLPAYVGLGLAILGALTLMSMEHKDA